MIEFEEAFTGWAYLSNEIRKKDQGTKLWKVIKKVNTIKEKYNALINATRENSKTWKKGTTKKGTLLIDSFAYGATFN